MKRLLPSTVFAGLSIAACVASVGVAVADSPSVLIRAKHVYTMDGPALSPGMVLVRDGKIVAVGESLDGEADQTLDVDSVTPGLVNAASTAGLVATDGESSREVTPQFETAGMIDFDSREFVEAIDGGETTVHLMPGTENVIAGWTCIAKTGGSLIEERNGVALSVCSDPTGRNRSRSRPESIYVRQPTNRMGVVWILRSQLHQTKLGSGGEAADGEAADGEAADGQADDGQASDDQASEPLTQMLGGEVPAFGVSRTAFDIQTLLRIGDEFEFKPVLVGGDEVYDVVDLIEEAGTRVIYTALDDRAFGREGSELFWSTPTRLRDAGIPYCIAGDGLLRRVRLAVRFGLTPEQALQAATADAAELLGIDQRVGKIKVGMDADLVGFSGLPTAMTSAVDWVLVDGEMKAGSWASETTKPTP